MVRELHAAGIEVILDVVFNHTAEGNELGPTFSFKGLENRVYYMLNDDGTYTNYSGCGNTVNGNHPIVREMIFHCLRHWVHNYHIDGFRFDLASILSRDRQGELVPNPPLVELIAEDPMLADTKIIAEAWDAAGAYQVGSFANLRWAEWNGRYRDDVRRFWRGDDGMTGPMATRLAGSSDLYQPSGRRPYHSINFITSHDGFTLNDLVSYERQAQRGQRRRTTATATTTTTAPTTASKARRAARASTSSAQRQIKNLLASLLLSQGVPMIVAGDEVPPHAARQQQRLLPGQRDQLVRLAAGREERRDAAVRAGADRVPPPQPDGAPRPTSSPASRTSGRAARRELVRRGRQRRELVRRRRCEPDLHLRRARRGRRPRPRQAGT